MAHSQAHRRCNGKGKSIDRSTPWSEYIWNEQGYWFRTRNRPSGELEYEREYPQDTSEHNSTPRTLNVERDNSEEVSAQTGSNIYVFDSQAAPATGSPATETPPQFGVDSGGLPARESNYTAQSHFHTSRDGYQLQSYKVPLPNELAGSPLNFTAPATLPIAPPESKAIYRAPNSPPYEELDARYRVVETRNLKRFWKIGRVFMMLWTSLDPELVPEGGGTRNGSDISTTWLKGEVYSEIRRFVVIAEGYGNIICSPIHTYSGQATLKPNLPEQQSHTIIHTSRRPPPEKWYYAEDGSVVRENLYKDPIRVVSEQDSVEGDLGDLSRLNYSRIYTVEMHVRVLNIGMVHANSLESLVNNCSMRPRGAKPTAPYRSRNPFITQIANPSVSSGTMASTTKAFEMIRIGPLVDQVDPQEEEISDTANSNGKLSDRYQKISSPSRFFKQGRVFKALWTEPAGNISEDDGSFVMPSRFGENSYTKIRHFVVIREMQGCCWCLPLNTYNQKGTGKDGIRPDDYAAVYPVGGEPSVGPEENMSKEPFPIKVEDPRETIHPKSRLNFGRVYTVEHNIKVLKVGRIPDKDLARFDRYFVERIAGPQASKITMSSEKTA